MGGGHKPQWVYPVAWRSGQPVEIARRYPATMMGNLMDVQRFVVVNSPDDGLPGIPALQEFFSFNQPAANILSIPLTLSGQVIGFVIGLASQEKGISEEDIQQVKAVAGQAAIAVESRLLLEQAQAKARQEQRLREVSANVFAASDVDAILRRAVEQVGRTLGAQAYIYLGQGNGTDGGSSGNGAHDVDETPQETVLVNG
jgi:GAF domain-containing protein